jgi:release factor glutamine methyltransferase
MMSLLLDEVALAALRLAEAGVESPRADAELIAASVHNVRRGELHTVPDDAFDGPRASRCSTAPAARTSATSSSMWAQGCSCPGPRPR